MATLSEHATIIRAAVAAARSDGYELSLEDANTDYPYVDLESHGEDGRLADWDTIIEIFD